MNNKKPNCVTDNNSFFCSKTLKYLLEELRKIYVDPDEVHIPDQLYYDLVDNAEDIAEANPEDKD